MKKKKTDSVSERVRKRLENFWQELHDDLPIEMTQVRKVDGKVQRRKVVKRASSLKQR